MTCVVATAAAVDDAVTLKHQAALYRAKVYQMIFHWSMAVLMYSLLPVETFSDPIQVTENLYLQAQGHVDRIERALPMALIYLCNATYHCILYFWDPVEASQLRLYHLLSIFLGTIFATMQQTKLLLGVLACAYVIDSFLFVSNFQRSQRSSACLRSMLKIHHMATIMLIALSWTHGSHVYGCFVMFLHDISDVPMFAIRLMRQARVSHLLEKHVFVVPFLLLTWTYYRIWVFGQFIASVFWHVVMPSVNTPSHLVDHRAHPTTWAIIIGMYVLWTFNVYWTWLVAKKGWQTVFNQTGAEHTDDE